MLLLLACAPDDILLAPERAADEPPIEEPIEEVAGSEDTAPQPPHDPDLYDDADGILALSLTVDGDAWESLRRDGGSFADATLGWDDREWAVAIHIKGSSSWQEIDQKPSLVVDANRVVEDQEFRDAKKFYLHNGAYDPSSMSEMLAYRFYRERGYPASRTRYARLTLNGEDYGLYTVCEPHNDDFLQAWFADPNGNLYENAEAYCDVDDLSCMEVEEDDEGGHDALLDLGVLRRPGPDWLTDAQAMLEWDRFIDYLALEASIVHWDSYSYDQSNYQLYHEPASGRWTMLTQAMDLDFGYRPWSYPNCGQYAMDPSTWTMGDLAGACQADATCHAAFVARVSGLADELEAADGAARVDALHALIEDEVKSDPRRYGSDRDYDDHVECLRGFFRDRPAQLREWVARQG